MKTEKVTISERIIKKYQQVEGVFQLKDKSRPIALRFNSKRTKATWYLIQYQEGKAKWLKLGYWPLLSYSLVKKSVAEIQIESVKGKKAEELRVSHFHLCGDLFAWYQKRIEVDSSLSESRVKAVRSAIKNYLMPAFGYLPVEGVSKKLIEERLIQAMLKNGRAPSTIKGVFTTLKTAFNSAEKMELIKSSKVSSVKFDIFQVSRAAVREGKIKQAWLAEIMEELESDGVTIGRALVFMMICHGTRVTETKLAKWKDIDLSSGVWNIPAKNNKSRRDHQIPLTDYAVEFLRRWHERLFKEQKYRGKYIFPASINTSSKDKPISEKMQHKLIKKVSHGDWTAHDTRKLCATCWMNAGEDYLVVNLLQNHALNKIDAAYMQGEMLERQRALLERWHLFLSEQKTNTIPRW